MKEYLKLFGLSPEATLNDVKKAYRVIAKKNHPDLFTDAKEKKKQELLMSGINEAYEKLIAAYSIPAKHKSDDKENDYTVYKKGIEYFNMCYEGVFVKMEKHDLKNKEENLVKAKSYFTRVLDEYPESDWAYDSEEKLAKIERMINNLKNNGFVKENKILPRKDFNFYQDKFKKMFRK